MPQQTLRIVFGDQLTLSIAALQGHEATTDTVLMMEVKAEGTYVPHHPQKIILILSAMRAFAGQLRAEGLNVRYVALNDPDNTHSFATEIERAVSVLKPTRVVVTHPGEWRVLENLKQLQTTLPVPLEILEDTRFISTPAEFATWANGKKQLRMEFFYREQRRKTGLLMTGHGDETKPEGGEWNYDKENREPFKGGSLALPDLWPTETDPAALAIVTEVTALVEQHFPTHFGEVGVFRWAITRTRALKALHHFIEHGLPDFGRYQDAMHTSSETLYHSLLSPALNIGLLLPLEVCQAAEAAYRKGKVPLASAEGFIRQILGWREYVRGLYWHQMPSYATHNALKATRPLPAFYWDESKTEMQCMKAAIGATRRNAYAHHIQRLMVTGNFALLAGLSVKEVTDWYLSVYADAFEWVELPNTLGMALFADGGIMASKPYAASGRYIDKMSNHCKGCRYTPTESIGEKACPFSMLYWDFMLRHETLLAKNPRMGPIMAQVRNMEPTKRVRIQHQAQEFLDRISPK
ncbi:MAG: cryptochrome/photolyase family protein [Pseudomonadota bacterium]